ncbi:DUF5518 domain-containing protein [Natronomonas salina]|uniref:DUF5518 domain-containing protein n=1 Tax=Natronomonas salina TaxID=1710540 RepID=UPI0015B740F5|nr:DUF5518 domain-containing protein [Natronomonas salina]QLD88347.1 DUF5518 domain-containing protein [Natronomonas salina]
MSPDSPSTGDTAAETHHVSAPPVEEPGDSRSTLVNALIGAAVGIVLSFVPLSPVLGGGVAGYLEGGDSDDGLRVGAIAGVVMSLPLAFLGLVVSTFFFGVGAPVGVGVLFLLALVFLALYTVGLGALGGLIGASLEDEF